MGSGLLDCKMWVLPYFWLDTTPCSLSITPHILHHKPSPRSVSNLKLRVDAQFFLAKLGKVDDGREVAAQPLWVGLVQVLQRGLAREPLNAQPSSSVKDGASSPKRIHCAIHHLHSP